MFQQYCQKIAFNFNVELGAVSDKMRVWRLGFTIMDFSTFNLNKGGALMCY